MHGLIFLNKTKLFQTLKKMSQETACKDRVAMHTFNPFQNCEFKSNLVCVLNS